MCPCVESGFNISLANFYDQIPKEYLNPLKRELSPDKNYNVKISSKTIIKSFIKDGDIYYGQIINGHIKNGNGKMIKKLENDDKKYINGIWENDELIYGRIIDKNGEYEGEIKDYLFNGTGKYIERDTNDYYDGNWENGEFIGEGEIKYGDGCIYKGKIIKNKKEGEGKMKWVNGCNYEGNFKNDIMDGKGIIIGNNGNKYEGEFKNGLYNGEGKFTWVEEKEEYKGSYTYGKKYGYGEYKFKNGNLYKGNWFDDKAHGEGFFETKNKVYRCNYQYGLLLEVTDCANQINGNDEEIINLNIKTSNEDIIISQLTHINTKLLQSSLLSVTASGNNINNSSLIDKDENEGTLINENN